MRKVTKATLGQSVSIGGVTPTSCLQLANYDSLTWDGADGVLLVGFRGQEYGVTAANISLLWFAPAEDTKKK